MKGGFYAVTEDTLGGIHLYCGRDSRPHPLGSWHGFRSYQDLSDFFMFALAGPYPNLEVVQPVATATDQAEASTASASASAQDAGGEVGAPGCDSEW